MWKNRHAGVSAKVPRRLRGKLGMVEGNGKKEEGGEDGDGDGKKEGGEGEGKGEGEDIGGEGEGGVDG